MMSKDNPRAFFSLGRSPKRARSWENNPYHHIPAIKLPNQRYYCTLGFGTMLPTDPKVPLMLTVYHLSPTNKKGNHDLYHLSFDTLELAHEVITKQVAILGLRNDDPLQVSWALLTVGCGDEPECGTLKEAVEIAAGVQHIPMLTTSVPEGEDRREVILSTMHRLSIELGGPSRWVGSLRPPSIISSFLFSSRRIEVDTLDYLAPRREYTSIEDLIPEEGD
ncbi:MAG: hypothetical protein JJU11_16165 [Candidatus Sumerlaeia bacterium]|nr:hypothetical protein [Candidatus Sumerlaeia bacterium]